MILGSPDIRRAMADGRLVIEPPPAGERFSTSSVDLVLGEEPLQAWDLKKLGKGAKARAVEPDAIHFPSFASKHLRKLKRQKDGSYLVPPGMFVLGTTLETIDLPVAGRLAARVEGRSRLGRLGLAVHLTAPTIHCGFRGKITLEMANVGPLKLKLVPGKTRICQLIVEQVSTHPRSGLQSPFQGQSSVMGR